MTVEIAGYDRPHRLHDVVRSSYMQVDGAVTFEEVDGGTRLRWDWTMGLRGVDASVHTRAGRDRFPPGATQLGGPEVLYGVRPRLSVTTHPGSAGP